MPFSQLSTSESKRVGQGRDLLFAVLFLPYFMPMGFAYIRDTSSVASALYTGFMAAEVLVSLAVLVCGIKRTVIDYSILSVGILCALMIFSSVLAGMSRMQATLVDCLSFLGLACLLKNFFKADFRRSLKMLTVISMVMTLGNLASVFLTEGYGFVPGVTPAGRIFLFGGKNSLFLFGIPAVASLSLYSLSKRGSLGLTPFALALLYCVTAFYIQSASSALCYGLLATFLFFVRRATKIQFQYYSIVYFIIIAIIFFAIVIAQDVSGLDRLFMFMDREATRAATFSGRTDIWTQALAYVAENPVFGNGRDVAFYAYGNLSLSTGHAHCYYLDSAVKYGGVFVAFFVVDILYIVRRQSRVSSQIYALVASSMFFLLLFHSLFDYMHLEVFVLLRAYALYADSTVFASGGAVVHKGRQGRISQIPVRYEAPVSFYRPSLVRRK